MFKGEVSKQPLNETYLNNNVVTFLTNVNLYFCRWFGILSLAKTVLARDKWLPMNLDKP